MAAAGGEVRFAGTAGSSGLTVSVRTGDGFDTSYLHLSSLAVRAGARVSAGERARRGRHDGHALGRPAAPPLRRARSGHAATPTSTRSRCCRPPRRPHRARHRARRRRQRRWRRAPAPAPGARRRRGAPRPRPRRPPARHGRRPRRAACRGARPAAARPARVRRAGARAARRPARAAPGHAGAPRPAPARRPAPTTRRAAPAPRLGAGLAAARPIGRASPAPDAAQARVRSGHRLGARLRRPPLGGGHPRPDRRRPRPPPARSRRGRAASAGGALRPCSAGAEGGRRTAARMHGAVRVPPSRCRRPRVASMGDAVLRDHADLLRERRAPSRARLHDDRRRRARAAHASARRGRLLPHRHGRARRAGRPGGRAARASRRASSATGTRSASRSSPPRVNATNDFFIRTTDPEHMAKVAEVVQRIYDNGHVYAGTYEGWYCPRCADFKTDAEVEDGNRCPIHKIVLEREKEDNWFFRHVHVPGAAREALRRAPGLRHAAEPLQRGALVHQGRPARRLALAALA